MQGMDEKMFYEERKLAVAIPTAQLTTAFVAIRTNSSGDVEEVTGLDLLNTTAGAITVSAEVVPSGGSTGVAANLVLDVVSLAAHERLRFYSKESPLFLAAGDTLSLKASGATAISARLQYRTSRTP